MAKRKLFEKGMRFRGKMYRIVAYSRKKGGIVANIVKRRRKK
jgi:hypothetical protein